MINARSGKRERISRLYQMHANKQNPMETVSAGDICAAVGFKEIRTGDTLCAENAPIVLEQMTFPEPVIGLAVEPKTQKDLDKLGIAVRTGQHCAEPVMTHYGVTGMCRASFAMYNTLAEADALVAGVERAVKMLK